MAGVMLVFWITSKRKMYLLFSYIWPKKRGLFEKISNERNRVSKPQILLGSLTTFLYLAARICLIVEVLFSIRRLPVGAYITVEWVNFLPHV